MKFFDKIFGNKDSQEPTNLEKIEAQLNCRFPRQFHEFIKVNSANEIILELADENYRILKSITSEDNIMDSLEQVVSVSNDMGDHQILKSKTTKLPFARNLSGDQFKYLFFEGEEGQEFNDQIFITDMDSLIGQLEITQAINLFNSKSKKETPNQIVVDCIPESIETILLNFELPKPISYWQKSFGTSSRENSEKYTDGFSVQQHAINYEFENPKENMAKFEMQSIFVKGDKLFFTSSAYEVDNSKLKGSIDFDVVYRTFYFKFFCIIDALIKSKEIAIEQNFAGEIDFIKLVETKQLIQITKQSFKSIGTKQV